MKLRKSDVRWVRLANETDTAMLRQHAYVPDISRVPYIGDLYIGNISLCHSSRQGNENEQIDHYENVKGEPFEEAKACKRCVEIFNKLE